MKPRILVIAGTRPDTIKLAPLIIQLRKNQMFATTFVTTGQHKELLAQALETFELKADIDFEVMQENQELYQTTMLLLDKLNASVRLLKPDMLIVQGDTLTAFVATLAGFYNQTEVMHIEAGLRTYDLKNPFPEEGFRQKIDRIAQHLIPPTQHAKNNLISEGTQYEKIYTTGNTVVDAITLIKPKITASFENEHLNKLDFASKKIILLTLHRREHFGQPIRDVFKTAIELTKAFKNIEIVYPIHPNPNVKTPAYQMLANKKNIHLIKPLSYIDTLRVLQKCYFVISDSGGIQEEAPTFNKQVLVTRKVTERPEGVKAGILQVVGTNPQSIFDAAEKFLTETKQQESIRNPFGDGNATKRIVSYLETHFGLREIPLPEFVN